MKPERGPERKRVSIVEPFVTHTGRQPKRSMWVFIIRFIIRKEGDDLTEFLLQTYTMAMPVIFGYIVWLLKQRKKSEDANGKGTMLLLRVQLIEYHDRYMAAGYIPSYAYENFVEMYEAYHNLGGNGMVTHMQEEVKKLEIRKERKNDET